MANTIDKSLFQLDATDQQQRRMMARWLQIGVLALAIAGIFAILLVLSRTPGMERFFPWVDFFRTALVVHVDQSVLIWFLAMAGVVWVLTTRPAPANGPWMQAASLLALIGTLGIAASAFFGSGAPLMNNYVPVLQRPGFFITLGLFGLGITIQLSLTLARLDWAGLFSGEGHITALASATVALSVLMSLIALGLSWQGIEDSIEGHVYYEFLFWGAGHTFQFAYTQLLMLCWLLLALYSGLLLWGSERLISLLILIGFLPVLLVPVIYLAYPVTSAEARLAFTDLMQFGGGVGAIPLGLLVLIALFRGAAMDQVQRPLRLSLWMSLLLFGAGGLISLFITGVNTIIPAHYHGSIVGVTMALMGLAYLILPKLGYTAVSGRLANLQPIIYGGGQLLHIFGLAVSGSMGIQRKTAGAAQGLDSLSANMAMGVMGIGGLLAVIGGILFVWIMLTAFWRRR